MTRVKPIGPLTLRPSLRLRTFEAAAEWAAQNGGAGALRKALTNRVFRDALSIRIAEDYLGSVEREASEAYSDEALELNRRAALAAERSARYAMYSAAVATVSAIIAVAAYLLTAK